MTEGEVLVPREPTADMNNHGQWHLDMTEGATASSVYRAMIAAAPPKEAEPWRPIADAPKDGTPVLLAGGRDDHADLFKDGAYRWMFAPTRAVWMDGEWISGLTEAGQVGIGYLDPTHWMPLPDPPSQKKR